MKKNGLIFLFIIILALLIGLIAFSSKNNRNVIQNPNGNIIDLTKENKSKVIWNGSNSLIYDDYIYYVDNEVGYNGESENKICRIKLTGESKVEVLYKTSQYDIENRLYVFNNNLFFTVFDQTLYMNLDDTSYIKKFCAGKLYSIQDGNIIYSYQNKICKAEYYRETLTVKNPTSLVSGNSSFVIEDDVNLYFSSSNSDGSISIFKVNKEKQYANVLDRIYMTNESELQVIDSAVTNKELYVLLEKRLPDVGFKYSIEKIEKDGSETELIDLTGAVYEIKYADSSNIYFSYYGETELKKYSEKSAKIESVKENDMPIIYSLQKEETSLKLYKNNSLICDICEVYRENAQNINIREKDNYIYIDFNLIDGMSSVEEYMIYRLKKDGTELERLNQNI